MIASYPLHVLQLPESVNDPEGARPLLEPSSGIRLERNPGHLANPLVFNRFPYDVLGFLCCLPESALSRRTAVRFDILFA